MALLVAFFFLVFLSGTNGGVLDDLVLEASNLEEDDLLQLLQRVNELEVRLNYVHANSDNYPNTASRVRRSALQGASSQDCTPGSPGCTSAYAPFYTGNCYMCPPGPRGIDGTRGPSGKDGRDGRDGMPGVQKDLCAGNQTTGENEEQEQIRMFQSQFPWRKNHSGVTYVRWGRKTCESPSMLVYAGSAGGSQHNVKGGATNYLCLPNLPIFDRPAAGVSGHRTYVYGAEYSTSDFVPLAAVHDFDVPCALCLATGTTTQVTVPARNVCPDGWTKEYSGYLMSERTHDSHRRSEFVCVDGDPEVIPRTASDLNGVLFQVAESRCASHGSGLPCGENGYVDGFELTCAVCTM